MAAPTAPTQSTAATPEKTEEAASYNPLVYDSNKKDQVFLFEMSWEVCHKVGGIYTVITTKCPVTIENYDRLRYILVGPYTSSAAGEFEALDPPDVIKATLDAIKKQFNISSHYGRWLVHGFPRVILFDLWPSYDKMSEWIGNIWRDFEIGIHEGDQEAKDCIVFGYLTFLFFRELNIQLDLVMKEQIAKQEAPKKTFVLAHFHEWQAAVGALLLKKHNVDVATVFTTHATLLGRFLCAAGQVDFYNKLKDFNPEAEAKHRNIWARYRIEQLSAHMADAFATVSEPMADECQYLLGRRPDVVTPNGLRVEKYEALHTFQNLHAKYKDYIHQFVRGHFHGGFYDFDLDNTLYFFTAGRYEFVNKGIDMYIEALGKLNKRLQSEGSKTTVVAFVIVPARTTSFNVETLKGQELIKELRDTVSNIVKDIDLRIFESVARGNIPDASTLLTQQDIITLKRRILAHKRGDRPPIVTHNMIDNANDPILNAIRAKGLFNAPHDRVKMIFHPEFITSTNPLFSLDYDQFVRGCHLGVFPSYYEPWGYTPAECAVMGVPSVTSNVSGFGSFIEEHVQHPDKAGIFVLDRRFLSPAESIDRLAGILYNFVTLNRRQRIEMRNKTERLSELLDWTNLGKYYEEVRDIALQRRFGKK